MSVFSRSLSKLGRKSVAALTKGKIGIGAFINRIRFYLIPFPSGAKTLKQQEPPLVLSFWGFTRYEKEPRENPSLVRKVVIPEGGDMGTSLQALGGDSKKRKGN